MTGGLKQSPTFCSTSQSGFTLMAMSKAPCQTNPNCQGIVIIAGPDKRNPQREKSDLRECRFILEQLVGPVPTEEVQPALPQIAAKARHAHYLLERGLLEVDGKPRDGRQRLHDGEWLPGELVDGLTDLTRGQR